VIARRRAIIPWAAFIILASAYCGALLAKAQTAGAAPAEPPVLGARVSSGSLSPLAKRLPVRPMVVPMNGNGLSPGRYGGVLKLLMAKPKDVRMMTVYGYARLAAYNAELEIVPDILERLEVRGNREFTLHLRKGHRWSDGHPFTAEDFRYYWEDVANDKGLAPFGLQTQLLVDGEAPRFEIVDETTVRYTWFRPNPYFVPALAAPSPLYIYRPAHYLKRFHSRYVDSGELERRAKAAKKRNWASLHHSKDRQYRFDNPDLPTLQPWRLTTPPPTERFVFRRNPYYHRVDAAGRQLPYIDEVVIQIATNKIIPAKTGSGESDLQARYIRFDHYTFLKESEKRNDFAVRLWRTVTGAQLALYPNLNVEDPVWRRLLRDVRFRRALSLAIDRHEINQVVYFGLAREGNNTILPKSPLFRKSYQRTWAEYDPHRADALLDSVGLGKRDDDGTRLLPDGRLLEVVVETAGESTEETDVLELIADSWKGVGIKLFTRPSQREVFRKRIFSGQTVMSVWSGITNGVPAANMSPEEFVPSNQHQLQWPKWGQHVETSGRTGEAADMVVAQELMSLNDAWRRAGEAAEQGRIWRRILEIHADQVFTIGIVNGTLQPVVVNNRLRNVPEEGIYNWDPGSYFGIYRPDTFWFTEGAK
jgi:peptide/nickel transport system substrate-binding protein